MSRIFIWNLPKVQRGLKTFQQLNDKKHEIENKFELFPISLGTPPPCFCYLVANVLLSKSQGTQRKGKYWPNKLFFYFFTPSQSQIGTLKRKSSQKNAELPCSSDCFRINVEPNSAGHSSKLSKKWYGERLGEEGVTNWIFKALVHIWRKKPIFLSIYTFQKSISLR